MIEPVTFSDLLTHFGTRTEMARQLEVSKSAVSEWKGVVPESRAWQFEVLTSGRFTAKQILAGRKIDQSTTPSARDR